MRRVSDGVVDPAARVEAPQRRARDQLLQLQRPRLHVPDILEGAQSDQVPTVGRGTGVIGIGLVAAHAGQSLRRA